MQKFIVRDKAGEFYTCLNMETVEAARVHMIEIVTKLRAMGDNLEYTIEPAPVTELFENSDWQDDWNNPASKHHY